MFSLFLISRFQLAFVRNNLSQWASTPPMPLGMPRVPVTTVFINIPGFKNEQLLPSQEQVTMKNSLTALR